MAWTAPHTYTDGEIVTHTTLNADIRDNLIQLDNHIHNDASGQGSARLNPDSILFVQGGEPTSVGDMRRNGTTMEYHDGNGTVNITGVSPATIASLRALGNSNGTEGANGTHTHVFTTGSASIAAGTGTVSRPTEFCETGSQSTVSPDIHTTGSSTIHVVGVFSVGGSAATGTLIYNGTIVGTTTLTDNSTDILQAVISVGSGTFAGTILYQPLTATGESLLWVAASILEVGTPS